MNKEYNHKIIEEKWQQIWAENKINCVTEDQSKPTYYVLDMFPYPSGAGLHVGHPLGYIASDIYSRYKRLKGFNVLHPMGYDSFGLPAEQYAIQTGQHPAITTEQNINRYRQQLDKMGFSYDWSRELRTSDPKFYKWTQWIFIKLFHSWYNPISDKAESIDTLILKFKNEKIFFKVADSEKLFVELTEKEQSDELMNFRLAYLAESYVNWCPALGTVLANDEVKEGVSERGGHAVERKLMMQWSLRITSYADRLLHAIEKLDWTDSLKESQKNWIGKSEGASIAFNIQNSNSEITVFTTRPDTIFGVSFLTLAPEHQLIETITTSENKKAVDEYIHYAKNRSERERQSEVKKITGQFTGAFATHPFSGKALPIWIGDYVLAGYGTGAVMGVPAHDTRDFSFAKHFKLEIPIVIKPSMDWDFNESSYDEKMGICINSDFLNGLEVKDAIKKSISEIEKNKLGSGKINFRLRDAIFGRQRYWGEPIPIYYRDGIPYTLDEKELPLLLPEIDKYLPTETGEPPLARAKDFNTKEGHPYELTTMPGWAGSSWYYLRYMDPENSNEFAGKNALNYWKQVDLYIGGSEHATGHLLYFRFWTKFLFDLGLIPFDEPAKKLINQGMIQGQSFFTFIDSKNKLLYPKHILANTNLELRKVRIPYADKFFNGFAKLDLSQKEFFLETIECQDFKLLGLDVANNLFDSTLGFDFEMEIEKMSKSKFNVVNPDDIVDEYGADTLRMYEMFLGPLEQSKPWNIQGIEGVHRFLKKMFRLFFDKDGNLLVNDEEPTKEELKSLHKTIKKIAEDIENFSFNTSVSTCMICVNELIELKCNKRKILTDFLICISPYAPHVAEELWQVLGNESSISFASYPTFNPEYLVLDTFSYPISINGKHRSNIEFSLNANQQEIEQTVLADEIVLKWLEGKQPKKIVFVKGKIVNVVV